MTRDTWIALESVERGTFSPSLFIQEEDTVYLKYLQFFLTVY